MIDKAINIGIYVNNYCKFKYSSIILFDKKMSLLEYVPTGNTVWESYNASIDNLKSQSSAVNNLVILSTICSFDLLICSLSLLFPYYL